MRDPISLINVKNSKYVDDEIGNDVENEKIPSASCLYGVTPPKFDVSTNLYWK
jgi:hypothetical protein